MNMLRGFLNRISANSGFSRIKSGKTIDEVKIYDKVGASYISLKLKGNAGDYSIVIESLNGDHVIFFPFGKAGATALADFINRNMEKLGE